MEELLTDVMLGKKQSRQSHKIGAVVRNRLNDKKYPCYTLLASRYCKHGLVIRRITDNETTDLQYCTLS